jgi:hypothetical protein
MWQQVDRCRERTHLSIMPEKDGAAGDPGWTRSPAALSGEIQLN